jgi:hypothetical protein
MCFLTKVREINAQFRCSLFVCLISILLDGFRLYLVLRIYAENFSSNLIVMYRSNMGAAVAQAVQCLTTDWITGVRSPTGEEDFSSSLCVQTGSGIHPASCTMGTGGPFPGGKARPGRDADHSPSSAEVKNESERYLLAPPPGASMACSGTALLFTDLI